MRYAAALVTHYRDNKRSEGVINVIRKTEFFSHGKAKKLATAFDAESPLTKTDFEDGSVQWIEWRTMSEKEFSEMGGI